ncbi:MAG TPA: c-type cytochrome [Dissulfurispiraceae bacterium]|nr:c-type cytochrome [Dissulfurispiraceae bacterium]
MSRVGAFLFCGIMLCGVVTDAQIYPGYMRQETPMMRQDMVRHRYVQLHGVPATYLDHRNPLKADEDVLTEGAKIYAEKCASCHGDKGQGDGPQGKDLDPPPSPLAASVRMPIATDSYLFWAIADGGRELKTAMPAFRDVLGDEAIWKVVLYLRFRTWTAPDRK